jgi:ABC-type lipoprotein release transport system permease subunit
MEVISMIGILTGVLVGVLIGLWLNDINAKVKSYKDKQAEKAYQDSVEYGKWQK